MRSAAWWVAKSEQGRGKRGVSAQNVGQTLGIIVFPVSLAKVVAFTCVIQIQPVATNACAIPYTSRNMPDKGRQTKRTYLDLLSLVS